MLIWGNSEFLYLISTSTDLNPTEESILKKLLNAHPNPILNSNQPIVIPRLGTVSP